MKSLFLLTLLTGPLAPSAMAQPKPALSTALNINQVQTVNGQPEGPGAASGIPVFRGVPLAAPPVGNLCWQAPQPVANWPNVRPAKQFGACAMQLPLFGDMSFRSGGVAQAGVAHRCRNQSAPGPLPLSGPAGCEITAGPTGGCTP